MATAFLAALFVVAHLRVAKADDLVVAALVLDQDSKLLVCAGRFLGLVVPSKNFAGIADLLTHSPNRPKI